MPVVNRRTVIVMGAAALLHNSAIATPSKRDDAVQQFTGGAPVQQGRVKLTIPPLVENGNAASLAVDVESPMTPEDHVRRLAVFNEANPLPDVLIARLGPRSGRAHIATRIRLADSQSIVAIAEMSNGTFWSASASVIVTLAACVEAS